MTSIRPSGIHGQGLFAEALIEQGTVIGKLEGTLVTKDGPHVLWLDEEQGFKVTNDLRFINHSDTPNAAYYDDLTVGAICDIHPGEEITHNYLGDEADSDEMMSFEDTLN